MTQPAPTPATPPAASTPPAAPASPAPAALPPAQPPPAAPVYVPPAQMTPAAPAAPTQPQYVPVMPIQPAPVEPEDGGKDWSKLPQWAQQEQTKLVDELAKRRISERTAVVNQHAYIAAGQLGVNPAALLGSMAFNQLASQLNASAPDFPAKLTEAINATLAANPWMAAVPATPSPGAPAAPAAPPTPPPTSGGEFPGGNPVGQPITEAQLAAMTPQQIAEAYEKGQLKHLL